MKYKKSDINLSLEDKTWTLSKIRLYDNKNFSESPWVKVNSQFPGISVLQNTALAFTPHPSWGAVLPTTSSLMFLDILASQELTLHPDAWNYYIEQGVMDDEGNFLESWLKKS